MGLDTEQAIADRYDDLFVIAENLCFALSEAGQPAIEIDTSALYLVVVAMCDDIQRYKEYHLSDPARQRSNAVKRSAYAAKWIMRFNPLIYPRAGHKSGIGEQNDGLANATLAIHYAMSNMEQFTGRPADLNADVYYGLIYDLVYRNVSGEALILILDLISKALKQEPLVEFEV